MTSQPSMGAVVASLQRTGLDTGIPLSTVSDYSSYWERTRTLYAPFECTTTMRSGNADVYLNEIPGGQYTNLQFQAHSLGLGEKFENVKAKYREANQLMGDIVKVTPSSKTVGDLAQFMVQNNLSAEDVVERAEELSFPKSVIEFMQGCLGEPYGGYPEPLRSKVLMGLKPLEGRPGANMAPMDFAAVRAKLEERFSGVSQWDVMSYAMYPDVATEFFQFREEYGPAPSKLETRVFLVGPRVAEEFEVTIERGKTLHIKTLAMAADLTADGCREVFFELNGQLRSVLIRDVEATKEMVIHPKADRGNKLSVGAPMNATILDVRVAPGDVVTKGQPLVVLSAMKMEMVVQAPADGRVKAVEVNGGMKVTADDLLVTLE